MRKQNFGMSLVETLVVLTVFITVVLITSQALFSALKGSKKSEVTVKVKQAANYVQSVMERELHSAASTSSCSSSRVDYTDSAGSAKFFECKSVGPNGYIDSSGGRITPSDVAVTSCSLSCLVSTSGKSVNLDMIFSQTGERPEESAQFQAKSQILLRN